MASDFISLNDEDTKELRKELGLPVTKDIRYVYKDNSGWKELKVTNYHIADIYKPSETRSLLITTEDGREIRILSDYLSEMQKSDFAANIKQNTNEIAKKKIENKIEDIVKKTTTTESETIENCQEVYNYVKVDTFKQKQDPNRTIEGTIGKRIELPVKNYTVVDIETTGINHFADVIIEVGAVKYIDGKEVSRYSSLVYTDIKISKKITDLTGISSELLAQEGRNIKEVVGELREFLADDIVVGHNFATFDSKFLEDAFALHLGCHFSNDYIDTLYLARDKRRDLKHHSLETLSEEYGIDYSNAHRAVEDCVINHYVYEYLEFGYLLIASEDENSSVENEELIEVSDFECGDWKDKINVELDLYIKEKKLPKKSILLMANKSRKTGKITSYSICIYEPDLVESMKIPERNSFILRIKLYANSDIIEIIPKNKKLINKILLPSDANLHIQKDSKGIKINCNSDNLIPYLMEYVKDAIDNYSSKASSFACCARYEDCSKEGKCIHPNLLFATACAYKKNIDNGNVFL